MHACLHVGGELQEINQKTKMKEKKYSKVNRLSNNFSCILLMFKVELRKFKNLISYLML